MGTQLVNLPLTSTLTDSKGNLISGTFLRASDATYINTSGVLTYSRGNRTNLVLYSEDTSQANWAGGATQTFTLTVNTTYLLSVHKAGVTLTLAAVTGAYTVLSGTTATYGSPVAFTMTTGGTVTVTTDTAHPKAQLEALPSGNVIGSDLMDQEALGAELITNGRFDTDTGWDKGGAWVISGGVATLTADSAILSQSSLSLTADKIYRLRATVTRSAGDYKIYLSNGTLNYDSGWITAATTVLDTYLVAKSTDANAAFGVFGSAFTGTVDNVSLCEVLSPAKGSFHHIAMLAGSTELITNGGFETAGAGGADVHANWTETVGGTDTITNETTDKYLGDDALKITNVDSGDTYQDQAITTTAGKLYKLVFYTRGDGTVGGRYSIYDASNSADIVATTATGVTGTTYTAVTKYFYTPPGCVSVRIRLQAPSAAGAAYFDYVSVRQVQQTWVKQGTETIEIDATAGSGGLLKITGGDSAYGPYLNLANANDMSADLTVGDTYQVAFNAYVASGDTVSVVVAASDHTALASVSVTPTSSTAYTLNFKATHATTNRLEFASLDSGDIIYIDSITIKKAPPLAYLSPGTYTSTAGTTATIPADPCYESNGLSIQGEASNLLNYSYDCSQWTNSNTSDAEDVTDPWGDANGATTITNTSTDGYISLATASLNAAYHTLSFFVKAGTSNDFTIMLYDTTASATKAEIDFSVTDGVVAVVASDTGTGGVQALGSTGWYRCWATTAAAVTAGNVHSARFYPGRRGATTGTETTAIYGAMLNPNAYLMRYIPTNGCPAITLTEAGSATNGYSWTMSAALKAAATDSGTMILEVIPGHAAAGGTGTGSGIVSLTNAATSFLYYDYTNTNFEATDGTNTAENDETIANATTYTVAVRWDQDANSGDGYLQVSEKHSGTWTHGTAVNFNDAYAAGDYLRLAYGNEYPFWIKNIKIFDGWVKDANLDSPRARMLFPILPFFGGVKAYQY